MTLQTDEEWPDTALAKTIYAHFREFEGLNDDEAADSTGDEAGRDRTAHHLDRSMPARDQRRRKVPRPVGHGLERAGNDRRRTDGGVEGMTDLWSPMDTAPYDAWFLARVEPEKSTQRLLNALGLPQELPRIIVARKMRGDKPGQVRCSKRHVLYTASGWNIPPVMMQNT